MVMLHAGKEVNRADRTDVCTFHLRPTILYRIAVEIQWSLYPELFHPNFIIRLEKMDLLTSFVGVVSYFMTNIGLARVLSQVLHV